MKLTRSTVTLLVGLALVLTIPLMAQMAGQGASEKGCAIPNLTPDQSAKIAKIKVDHQKALIQLQAALKTKRLELRQLMMEKADQKRLEAKIDEIAKAGADIQKSCLAHKTAVKGLLTDEQKKALEEKCGGMSCGGGMGHGARMGHGGGCGGGCNGHKMMGKMEKGGEAAKGCGAEGCGSQAGCKK
jgi:Spy/CpxP family protein refolding chaperone